MIRVTIHSDDKMLTHTYEIRGTEIEMSTSDEPFDPPLCLSATDRTEPLPLLMGELVMVSMKEMLDPIGTVN